MDEAESTAWWMKCPYCDEGRFETHDDEEYIICPQCEGQGEICDRCGAPPSYMVGDEHRGGCWCHY